MINDMINLFVFIAAIAAAVQSTIDTLKPIFLDEINKKYGERMYLGVLYAVRLLASFVGVLLFGGAETLRAYVPTFSTIPDAGIIVVGSLFVASGSDFIHIILDYLYALRDVKRGDADVTRTVIVDASGDGTKTTVTTETKAVESTPALG